jgi:hypothetical protein
MIKKALIIGIAKKIPLGQSKSSPRHREAGNQ